MANDESAWSDNLPSECDWYWMREGPEDKYPRCVRVIDNDGLPFAIEEAGKYWYRKFTDLPSNCQWQLVQLPKP